MLLWMFNNLFYTALITGLLFSLGSITLYQIIQQMRENNAAERFTSPRRLASIIVTCVCLVAGIIGFVLALYADYMAQGTIINRWALAFTVGVVLITLLYSAIPSVARGLDKHMRNEK